MTATAVFETVFLYPNGVVGAWIATFRFVFDGLCYDYPFACGMLELTASDARDIMEGRGLLHEARSLFLYNVDLKKEKMQ